MKDLGSRLRNLRNKKGLTQEQLADKLLISKSMVSAFETEARTPSSDIVIKLAKYFNVTTDYLYGLDNRELLDTTGVPESISSIMTQLVDYSKETKKPKG